MKKKEEEEKNLNAASLFLTLGGRHFSEEPSTSLTRASLTLINSERPALCPALVAVT